MNIDYSQENSRLAAKYNFIVYPLDFEVLKKVLRANDYKIPQSPPSPSPDAIMSVDGIIGKKDEFTVDVNTERQIFGLTSGDHHLLESEFNKLENSISKEIGSELQYKARFYEFVYHAVVKTGSNPMEVMTRLGTRIPIYDEISKIVGQQASPLNLRVCPANALVESEDWFDLTIEPVLNKATVAYHIAFIFRNKDKVGVFAKMSNLNNLIEHSLKLIESK